MSEKEKIYYAMRDSAIINIVVGIVVLVAGISCGVLSIINGASLLKKKNRIVF